MSAKSYFFWALIFLGIITIGCNTGTSTGNDPNEVLKTFFDHLSKKDIDGAAKYATSDSKATLQMMKKGLDMAEKLKDSLPDNDVLKEFEKVVIEPARISGDSAFVVVRYEDKQKPNAEFKLRKEDNGWKVDFTMTALMGMGLKAGKEKGSEVLDSINKKMNSEEMKKGMKLADSVLKNIGTKSIEELQKQLEKLKE